MNIICTVSEVELENDSGNLIPGVQVTCPRCDHVTESFGTSERSLLRCAALLREACPRGERNFYVVEE